MDASFFVYILASKRNGTLYVGVTTSETASDAPAFPGCCAARSDALLIRGPCSHDNHVRTIKCGSRLCGAS